MTPPKKVSVRKVQAGAELRALREKRHRSYAEVAEALGCSRSKISRMESGDRGLNYDDVVAMLVFLKSPAELRHRIVELLRAGDERNWHEIEHRLPTDWRDVASFERRAIAVRNFEPQLFPGLAQTPDYVAAMLRVVSPRLTEEELPLLVEARLDRQQIVFADKGPRIHLIIDEMVLRRRVGGPAVLRGQLRHLLALCRRRNVTVQIVPFSAAGHTGLMGPMLLLDLPSGSTLAYIEGRSIGSFLEDNEPVATVNLAWQKLQPVALSPQDSERLIGAVLQGLTPEDPQR